MNNITMKIQRVSVLGINIHVVNYETVLDLIVSWVRSGKSAVLCFVNVYTSMMCQEDLILKRLVNAADLVLADGMPIVWMGQHYNSAVTRVYGTTLVRKLLGVAEAKGMSVYFFGGQNGQSHRLYSALLQIYPRLRIVGIHEAPSRPILSTESSEVLLEVNKSKPNILLLGLGCPHQEQWVYQHKHKLLHSVVLGVGSTFDFLSGDKKEAPEWMQRNGLAWLFRFLMESKRLWYRYTVVSGRFLWHAFCQLLYDKLDFI